MQMSHDYHMTGIFFVHAVLAQRIMSLGDKICQKIGMNDIRDTSLLTLPTTVCICLFCFSFKNFCAVLSFWLQCFELL